MHAERRVDALANKKKKKVEENRRAIPPGELEFEAGASRGFAARWARALICGCASRDHFRRWP